ncbi:MAG: DNA starvation/stationary phase protection protein, partial [Actinobacteria bacterium]|nr:DNA starvation/stationary phase protection protein [Actinomycetota bacterium]
MATGSRRKSTTTTIRYTVPGVSESDARTVVDLLQDRLNALNDLALTLKHIHWNVVGPHFIAVHTMLDPQVDAVRLMVDDLAERIATLGGSAIGTPGALVSQRSWDDYSLGRADALEHLGALDVVYTGVIEAHREAIDKSEDADPVTQDMLIEQAGQLEQFHW